MRARASHAFEQQQFFLPFFPTLAELPEGACEAPTPTDTPIPPTHHPPTTHVPIPCRAGPAEALDIAGGALLLYADPGRDFTVDDWAEHESCISGPFAGEVGGVRWA